MDIWKSEVSHAVSAAVKTMKYAIRRDAENVKSSASARRVGMSFQRAAEIM